MNSEKKIPRGIRNNNPLNIRIGNTWLGEVSEPTDSDFEQFVSMKYGLRAGFVILRRYIRRYGRNTISKIISSWAPSSENNTQQYIRVVSSIVGIPSDRIIRYEDKATLCAIVGAMVRVECGELISPNIIEMSYDIA